MKNQFSRTLSLALIFLLSVTTPVMGQTSRPPDLTPVDSQVTITGTVIAGDLSGTLRTAEGHLRLILELNAPPLALHAPASQEMGKQTSQAYLNDLASEQTRLVQQLSEVAPSARVDYSYQVAFNGLAVTIEPQELSFLQRLPGVKRIYPDRLRQTLLDSSTEVINAPALWADLGGQANAGAGIKVAVIDTGIRSDNPMFTGTGFSMPDGYPVGYCADNPTDPDFQCNPKLIAARFYTPTFTTHISETLTPLDLTGHGTHVAGIAVGNIVEVPAGEVVPVTTTISGVAPGAYLMVYKAFFRNQAGDTVSSDSMVLAALDDALLDGADVINNSWGGSPGSDPNDDPYLSAIKAIHAAGVVQVFGAGNSGPEPGTIACPGCVEEAITVASSTANRIYANTLDLTGPGAVPADLVGIGALSGSGPDLGGDIEAEIRYSGAISPANAEGCNPFAADTFQDSIALIRRGTCSFATKVDNAQNAGALSAVIYNDVRGAPIVMGSLGSTTIPALFLSIEDGEAVRDWITSTITATARLNAAIARVTNPDWQDIMADTSSTGPNGDPDILKPDITAPGDSILSATSPVYSGGQIYAFSGGTSAATPHVSGAAALLLQLHPGWTPTQVKTALTSTSIQELVKPDKTTPADAFNLGAGRLDLARARNAGLTFSTASFASYDCLFTCNWEDITIQNVTAGETSWTAKVEAPEDMQITIIPDTFTLAGGESSSFDLSIDVSQLPQDQWHFASITWSENTSAHPYAYLPIAIYPKVLQPGELTKVANALAVKPEGTVQYTITLTNDTPLTTTYYLSDTIPANGSYITGSATGSFTYNPVGDILTATVELSGAIMQVNPNSLYGYISLADGLPAPVPPFPCPDAACDDSAALLSGMDFYFNNQHVTDIAWSTNGFIQIDPDPADPAPDNQALPDPAEPNNLIAPLWADLDLDGGDGVGGGTLYMAPVTDGTYVYTVFEWENAELKGDPSSQFTFQVWIRHGTDDIWFTYDTITGNLSAGTIGMENALGNLGDAHYYNGTGEAPAKGVSLKAMTIFDTASLSYALQAGDTIGAPITNIVEASQSQNATILRAQAKTYIRSTRVYLPIVAK